MYEGTLVLLNKNLANFLVSMTVILTTKGEDLLPRFCCLLILKALVLCMTISTLRPKMSHIKGIY